MSETYLTSLLKSGAWWETGAADRAASSASRSQDVLASWVNWGDRQLANVQVSWVTGLGAETVVTVGDDGVKEVLEEGVGLLVTGDGANSFDVWMT